MTPDVKDPPKKKVAVEKRKIAKKPEPEKKPEPKKVEPKQQDLLGQLAYREVDSEEKTTVTEIFTARHFGMRITASALDKAQDMEDPEKRRKKLWKRVKALPDVESIPEGAKKAEAEQIIAKALATNVRGKF